MLKLLFEPGVELHAFGVWTLGNATKSRTCSIFPFILDVSLVNYRTPQSFWQNQKPLSAVIIREFRSSHLLEIGDDEKLSGWKSPWMERPTRIKRGGMKRSWMEETDFNLSHLRQSMPCLPRSWVHGIIDERPRMNTVVSYTYVYSNYHCIYGLDINEPLMDEYVLTLDEWCPYTYAIYTCH
jgi:hypothetical protein